MQPQNPAPSPHPKGPICEQPGCALRFEAVDATLLTDVVLAVLSGEEIPTLPSGGPIVRRDVCRECVQAIFDGRSLPPTAADLEEHARQAAERLVRRRNRMRRGA